MLKGKYPAMTGFRMLNIPPSEQCASMQKLPTVADGIPSAIPFLEGRHLCYKSNYCTVKVSKSSKSWIVVFRSRFYDVKVPHNMENAAVFPRMLLCMMCMEDECWPIRLSNASKGLSGTTAGQGIKEVRIIAQRTCAVLHRAIASKELRVVSQESVLGMISDSAIWRCTPIVHRGHPF